MIVTTALNQSQMDMWLSSSRAKQEAYWAELQRANESLWEDLPTGLELAPLGTERSVVSSMPPNEMHRVIWLTICIILQASRACAGDTRPDIKMSCRSIFTAHQKEASAPASVLVVGNIQYMIKDSNIKLCSAWCLLLFSNGGDVECGIPFWWHVLGKQSMNSLGNQVDIVPSLHSHPSNDKLRRHP